MKLIVGGCSISNSFIENPSPDEVYGQIVANNIGADYVHHGTVSGSNYRIWRKITQMVMNNEITKDDMVIIQYTEITRQEFWSASERLSGQYWKERYDKDPNGGSIVKFKVNTDAFIGKNSNEKKFFQLKEEYFTSPTFDEERFEYNHYLFHNLLKSRNIKVAYLVSPNRPLHHYNWNYKHLFNKNGEKHITLSQGNDEYLRHLDDGSIDEYHFGKEGHKYIAMEIEKFIKDNQWQ